MLRLKALREQRGLNQTGLALKLNLSQSTISAYEVGERTPDLQTLIVLADFFQVSLDYLTGLSEIRLPVKESDLSSDELVHLRQYRQLRKHDQEKLQAYLDGMLSRS